MATLKWIGTTPGMPVVSDFTTTRGAGTPIIIDESTDNAYYLKNNVVTLLTGGGGGSGTVTSVGLALPVSVFSITGSPVTTIGTLTGSFITQTANTVFAGPATGSPAVPTFRALVAADIPGGGGGGAGTKTLATLTCMTSEPDDTSWPRLDTEVGIAVLHFDDTATQYAYWTTSIPEAAVLTSGIKVRVFWYSETQTGGGVSWGAAFGKLLGDNIGTFTFGTETFAIGTASGTAKDVFVTEITATAIDSVAVGDVYRLRVGRTPSETGDNMADDAVLIAVEVRSAA